MASKNKKSNSDWRTIERIVHILEKYNNENSLVRHDVRLPVPDVGGYRQCDIVIETQQPEKLHRTIVEVQKRKSAVDINTFGGWIEKMRDVEADQLICVTKMKYPKSIISRVKLRYGVDKISLMSLKEFNSIENPPFINLQPQQLCTKRTYDFVNASDLLLSEKDNIEYLNNQSSMLTEKLPMSFASDEPLFCVGDETVPCSLDKLICLYIDRYKVEIEKNLSLEVLSYPVTIKIGPEGNIFVLKDNKRFRITSWEISVIVKRTYELRPIQIRQFTYQHEIIFGSIVWIARAHVYWGDEKKEADFIFTPTENGITTIIEMRPITGDLL